MNARVSGFSRSMRAITAAASSACEIVRSLISRTAAASVSFLSSASVIGSTGLKDSCGRNAGKVERAQLLGLGVDIGKHFDGFRGQRQVMIGSDGHRFSTATV